MLTEKQTAFLRMVKAEYDFLITCGWERQSDNNDFWIMPRTIDFPASEIWNPDPIPQDIAIKTAVILMDKRGLYELIGEDYEPVRD